jgi:hypothetical protein
MCRHHGTDANSGSRSQFGFGARTEKNVNNMFATRSVIAGTPRRPPAYTHRDQGRNAVGAPVSTEQTNKLTQLVYLCTDGRLLVPLGVIR